MRRETPASNLYSFTSSELAFRALSPGRLLRTWLNSRSLMFRYPHQVPKAKAALFFEAQSFLESALWLELGIRTSLFDGKQAFQECQAQVQLIQHLTGWRGGVMSLTHKCMAEFGWPFPDQANRLIVFDRSFFGLRSRGTIDEDTLSEYFLASDLLLGSSVFVCSCKRVLVSSDRDWSWGLKYGVNAVSVGRSLYGSTGSWRRPGLNDVLAGFFKFLEFAAVLRDLANLADRNENALSTLRQAARIQYWRMNLSLGTVQTRVKDLIGLADQLANSIAKHSTGLYVKDWYMLRDQVQELVDFWAEFSSDESPRGSEVSS